MIEVSWHERLPPIPPHAIAEQWSDQKGELIPGEWSELVDDRGRLPHPTTLRKLGDLLPGGMQSLHSHLTSGSLIWHPHPSSLHDQHKSHVTSEPSGESLNSEQTEALSKICARLNKREFSVSLLWGPTGSGKTAIYCGAIRRAWANGRRVLFLVPEIGLASQLIDRLEATIGERVAVWHSGLSVSERYWTARLVAQGRYRLIVGARSAVFAPIPDLGLIVVDEEHGDSYKQSDPAPRYHARDVAVFRARLNRAVCLLGSATPSVESYHNATTGKYDLLRLTRRVRGRQLPVVRIVDLRSGATGDGRWISPALREALVQTIREGRKAIIFLNRRGHSTMVTCRRCGHSLGCPNCAVTLTYHVHDRSLRCHFCTYSMRAPDACPACQTTEFLMRGVGTQKLVELLQDLDAPVRMVRLDADVSARRGQAEEVLRGFAGNRYNLLVGTQMVAKGLHVADVDLIGVIWADQQMAFPDFRAEERTFQLMTQVAGRAGRGTVTDHPGLVIVQTFHPDHELIELAAQQDVEQFF